MSARPVDGTGVAVPPAIGDHQAWPSVLWLVRHGQSMGNVARDAAEVAGHPTIELTQRDVDVPLSPLGERQARALGRWFASRGASHQPTVVLASPYVRAMQTAERIVEAAGIGKGPLVRVMDERLREKEFGSLNRLTHAGVVARFPEEAARRAEVGKFYYRPPGGESWCDVLLRARSVVDHLQLQYRGERVLLVAHQVIVLCFRYLLEGLDEEQILAIDRQADVAHCAVTEYARTHDTEGRGGMKLRSYNLTTPLEDAGEAVTRQPETPEANR